MPLRVDLFCEDAAHESFARALVERIAKEEGIAVTIKIGSARAGLPRLQRELRAFSAAINAHGGTPDILVIVADANGVGPAQRRAEIEGTELSATFPRWVIGTPDPCVEAWFLADPDTLANQFDTALPPPPPDDGDVLKEQLLGFLQSAGETVTQGGAEFADEIVASMDLYRAGQRAAALRSFVDDLRATMRQANLDL